MNQRERELAAAMGKRRPTDSGASSGLIVGWFSTRPTPVRLVLVVAVFLPAAASSIVTAGVGGRIISVFGIIGMMAGMQLALGTTGDRRWSEVLLPGVQAAIRDQPDAPADAFAVAAWGERCAKRDPEAWKAAGRGLGS